MLRAISKAEVDYVIQGCDCNIRGDGRASADFRNISVETDILPHVNGSSRVTIGNSTDIICSVKVEVSEPAFGSPDTGSFEVSCDISPACNLKMDDRKLQEVGSQISEQLQLIYGGSKAIDLEALCIIKGKFCWIVHIDILILRQDGNMIDGCSLAAYIALQRTRIPKVDLLEGESGQNEDFELSSGDFVDATPLKLNDVPICVTISKIDKVFLLDCTAMEEACASVTTTIAMDGHGRCCGVRKSSGGKLLAKETEYLLMTATLAAKSIFPELDNVLVVTEKELRVHPDAPFVRIGLLA